MCHLHIQIGDDRADVVPRQMPPGVGNRRVLDRLIAAGIVLLEPSHVAHGSRCKALRNAGLNRGIELEANQPVELTTHRVADGAGHHRREHFGGGLLQAQPDECLGCRAERWNPMLLLIGINERDDLQRPIGAMGYGIGSSLPSMSSCKLLTAMLNAMCRLLPNLRVGAVVSQKTGENSTLSCSAHGGDETTGSRRTDQHGTM